MEDKYIFTQGKRLRCGYTTGTCAQAAARAAAIGFFTGDIPKAVDVTIPDGTKVELAVEEASCGVDEKSGWPFAVCAVRKDAGDDIDVTDGMLVFAKVTVQEKTEEATTALASETETTDPANRDNETEMAVLKTRDNETETADLETGGSETEKPVPETGRSETETTSLAIRGSETETSALETGRVETETPTQETGKGETKTIVPAADGEQNRIRIRGGIGVGRVTKPGLDQPVGEAAINSTPRRMIRAEVVAVMEEVGEEVPLDVEIFLPDGAERAKKTMNERLGILGGLSILGTTGIVEPQSHRALIETIRAELSMRHAAGERELLITPGNYGTKFIENSAELFRAGKESEKSNCIAEQSQTGKGSGKSDRLAREFQTEKKSEKSDRVVEQFQTGNGSSKSNRAVEQFQTGKESAKRNHTEERFHIDEELGKGDQPEEDNPAENAVKCSNFIGDTLDAAIEFGFTRVTLVGHIGKLVKLAGGMMNTHSMYGDCRMELLAACGLKAGVPQKLLAQILDCVTCDDALRILSEADCLTPVMKLLGDRIWYHLNYHCKGKLRLRVVVFSNVYGVLADLASES